MIVDPLTIDENSNIESTLKLMADNKIGGVPVVDAKKTFVGIVTNLYCRFEKT